MPISPLFALLSKGTDIHVDVQILKYLLTSQIYSDQYNAVLKVGELIKLNIQYYNKFDYILELVLELVEIAMTGEYWTAIAAMITIKEFFILVSMTDSEYDWRNMIGHENVNIFINFLSFINNKYPSDNTFTYEAKYIESIFRTK